MLPKNDFEVQIKTDSLLLIQLKEQSNFVGFGFLGLFISIASLIFDRKEMDEDTILYLSVLFVLSSFLFFYGLRHPKYVQLRIDKPHDAFQKKGKTLLPISMIKSVHLNLEKNSESQPYIQLLLYRTDGKTILISKKRKRFELVDLGLEIAQFLQIPFKEIEPKKILIWSPENPSLYASSDDSLDEPHSKTVN